MAFNPGSTNSVAGSNDAALSGLASQEVLTYDGISQKWQNATPTGSGSATPGRVYFDDFFTGADDDAKVASLNIWAQAQAGAGPAVVFDTRQYDFSTPIKLFSGLKLIGGAMVSSRHYGRSTTFNWQGGSDSSLFVFPSEGQTGQAFPANDSPRDVTIAYIQLQGGSSTSCLPKLDPASDDPTDQTLWYSQFHGCGFRGFDSVWHGWGQGSSISGQTYFEAIGDTALYLGGESNRIFGNDAVSKAASTAGSQTSTPFLRSRMSMSHIGNCVITARGNGTMISVEAGSGLNIDSVIFEGAASVPLNGAGLVVKGGSGVTVSNCVFKGLATNPSSGWEGASNNRGWIHVSGGSQISLANNSFRREGSNMPATSYPLLFAAEGLPSSTIKWSFNSYSGYGGSPAVLRQAVDGQISALNDPLLNVTTGA